MKRTGSAFVLGYLLAALLLPAPARASHNWEEAPIHWHSPIPIQVKDGPNTNDCFKDRVRWASAPTQAWSWSNDSDAPTAYGGTGLAEGNNKVLSWGDLAGTSNAAVTTWSRSAFPASDGHYTLVHAHVTFDSTGVNWNYCDDDAPAGEVDLWSVITHEIGHLLFLNDMIYNSFNEGRFPPSKTYDNRCYDWGDQPTMCQPNYAGTERQRVLELEDVLSANKAY